MLLCTLTYVVMALGFIYLNHERLAGLFGG
jgi:hypothetical protein